MSIIFLQFFFEISFAPLAQLCFCFIMFFVSPRDTFMPNFKVVQQQTNWKFFHTVWASWWRGSRSACSSLACPHRSCWQRGWPCSSPWSLPLLLLSRQRWQTTGCCPATLRAPPLLKAEQSQSPRPPWRLARCFAAWVYATRSPCRQRTRSWPCARKPCCG